MDEVIIRDSIDCDLFTVKFNQDHLFELLRRKVIRVYELEGRLYQVMKHTDLIKAINEMAA